MDTESEKLLDTSVTTIRGMSTRRSKVYQTERDKNQENIEEAGQPDALVSATEEKNGLAAEDKPSSSTPNSSTPRRRKDPLANLHSNLSPKYIGFVTPTSSNLDNSSEERIRSKRRRNNISNSIDTSITKETSGTLEISAQLIGAHESSVGYVRRTPKEMNDSPDRRNGRRKEFVSPIDKLLKKNGAIVDNVNLSMNEESSIDNCILSTDENMFAKNSDAYQGEVSEDNEDKDQQCKMSIDGNESGMSTESNNERTVCTENGGRISTELVNYDEDKMPTEIINDKKLSPNDTLRIVNKCEAISEDIVKTFTGMCTEVDDENCGRSSTESVSKDEGKMVTDIVDENKNVTTKNSENENTGENSTDNFKDDEGNKTICKINDEISTKNNIDNEEFVSNVSQNDNTSLKYKRDNDVEINKQQIQMNNEIHDESEYECEAQTMEDKNEVDTKTMETIVNDTIAKLVVDKSVQKPSASADVSQDLENSNSETDLENKIQDVSKVIPEITEYPNEPEVIPEIQTPETTAEPNVQKGDESPVQFKVPSDVLTSKDMIEGQWKEDINVELQKNGSTLETLKCDVDSEETAINTDFVNDTASAQSPSAVSTDSAKGSSILNEGTWMTFSTGDLFWGQIYNYCYWPCMVCPDPEGKTISTKENNVMVHVRFFADNARRNWVRRENLMAFTTLDHYQERLEECKEKYGSKSAKFKTFVPKKAKVKTWYDAVSEANLVAEAAYEARLEKFYEIFEKSKTFQKQRQRRKSMYIPSIGNHSEGESLYGSSENVYNLSVGTTNLKRERSISPYSPAYSPVKSVAYKKRKLSRDEESTTSAAGMPFPEDEQQPSKSNANDSTQKSLKDLEIFKSVEFKKLYVAMKDFVLEQNSDEHLEKSLIIAVRNIWGLRQLSREQMRRRLSDATSEIDTASPSEDGVAVKRLSSRLKSIMVRKSLLAQRPSLDSPTDVLMGTPKQEKDAATGTAEKPRKSIVLNRPILEVIDDIFGLDNKYLFKGMSRDPVCKYCFKPGGNLKRCVKNCSGWLHNDCLYKDFSQNAKARRFHKNSISAAKPITDVVVENNNNNTSITDLMPVDSLTTTPHITAETETEVTCKECANSEPSKCMVCKLTDSSKLDDPLVKCCMNQCERFVHPGCCKYWPQSKITISKSHIQSFRCPSHVCHTCVSDDPKGKFQQLSNSKLTKCVKCPATYHMDSTCIPAGSQILTAAHIICPRHVNPKHDMTLNVNWCFICVKGGQVVCCETCPTAVHAQCLKIPIDPNEGYICEECESGRMPLYGEMVWAKFNNFRWWPAIILPPTEVPRNIVRKAHNPSDFVVRFFGTHDHGWISRRRVYLYLEGDCSEPPRSKSTLDLNYQRGIEEAKKMYEIIKAKKLEQRGSNENKEKLHPQPYVRIKANRAVPPVKLHIDIESVSKCECNPKDENPCGSETNCLNRVLYHECNPKVCPAGDRCQNQMFESRKSPRLDVIYMKERGFGLVCLEPIKAGTFIIEYVGEVINDNECRARMAQKSLDRDENFYFLSVEKDYIIDAGPKGNLARFMNHSCDPNCETQKWSVNTLNRVGLFAIRDIPENSELTFNYHWDDLLGNEKKTCFCGSKNCAGQIGGKIKDESKETFAIFSTAKAEGKTKTKSKLKTVKRLHSKSTAGKRKTVAKLKMSGTKQKTKKLAAAAFLETPELKDVGKDKESDGEALSSQSLSPKDIFC